MSKESTDKSDKNWNKKDSGYRGKEVFCKFGISPCCIPEKSFLSDDGWVNHVYWTTGKWQRPISSKYFISSKYSIRVIESCRTKRSQIEKFPSRKSLQIPWSAAICSGVIKLNYNCNTFVAFGVWWCFFVYFMHSCSKIWQMSSWEWRHQHFMTDICFLWISLGKLTRHSRGILLNKGSCIKPSMNSTYRQD